MKKLLSLVSICCILSLNAQSAQLTECQKNFRDYQYVGKNSKWKDFSYDAHYGKILYKEVEYFNKSKPGDSKKYWLFQLVDSGYFYFGDIRNKKSEKKFYNNENDALVALFIWQCSKVYLDEGLISEGESLKISLQ